MKKKLSEFIGIIHKLESIDNCEPNPEINQLLSDFVSLASNPLNNTQYLYDELRPYFETTQKICIKAEEALEYFWAEKILRSKKPFNEINNFPYIRNYEILSGKELRIIEMNAVLKRNILFIGAGSLPLTAFFYRKVFGNITIIDRDKTAINYSNNLAKKLDITNLNYHNVDIRNINCLKQYDVIVLAASVGDSTQKADIINNIYNGMNIGATLIIRSVSGIKELLYPKVLQKDAPFFASQLGYFEFDPPIINSVIVLNKKYSEVLSEV